MWELRLVQKEEDLEQALALRKEIFVREQGIPAELDEDGFDDRASHILVLFEGQPVATGRLLVSDEGSDGVLARIAVRSTFRGRGLGQLVVSELEGFAESAGVRTLTLHPHHYLERFYRDLGYLTVSGTDTVGGHELITMSKRLADG